MFYFVINRLQMQKYYFFLNKILEQFQNEDMVHYIFTIKKK